MFKDMVYTIRDIKITLRVAHLKTSIAIGLYQKSVFFTYRVML